MWRLNIKVRVTSKLSNVWMSNLAWLMFVTFCLCSKFFTSKQAFFGPNPTFLPLPPCNVVRKERLADESSNIGSGEKGERANIATIREKGTLSHTFRPGLSISRTFTTNAHNSKCMECTVSKFVWVKFVHVLHTSLTSRL